jgi:hypothetical protein
MNKPAIAFATLLLAGIAPACVSEAPTPAARAANVERLQCSGARESQEDLRILQTTTVVSAEPTYFPMTTGGASGAGTITGAKLVVRAPEGVSSIDLARALQCHSARTLLGQVDSASISDDPYSLPDAWVDIDVKPEGSLLAVRVTADRVPQNLALLHRAMAYADAHRAPGTR